MSCSLSFECREVSGHSYLYRQYVPQSSASSCGRLSPSLTRLSLLVDSCLIPMECNYYWRPRVEGHLSDSLDNPMWGFEYLFRDPKLNSSHWGASAEYNTSVMCLSQSVLLSKWLLHFSQLGIIHSSVQTYF